MYILGLGDMLKEGIAGVILLLDTIIYGLISGAYKIFMALASARILSSDAYTNIANSLYAIIGVVMLFVLAYAIIRMIMDPDQTTKGEMSGGNLVKGIAIAVLGLAITPTIFEFLYQAQGLFVERDVIGKIFFRNFDNNEIDLNAVGLQAGSNDPCQNQSNSTAKVNCYVKSVGGAVTATSIWTAFFYPSNPCDENGQPAGCKGADDITIKATDFYVKSGQLFAMGAGVVGALALAGAIGWIPGPGWIIGGLLAAGALIFASVQAARQGNKVNELTGGEEISLAQAYSITSSGDSFMIYTGFLSKYQSDGEITYLWGVSTLCGIFALYSFVSFSIDMGVRAAKLAYYQIIAPIPLVLQILPKFKKNFTQYVSSLLQTFMEVFIRISVVYIVVYIICHLTDMFSSADKLWNNNQLNFPERTLALALLIMGLIIFAKDAPKIITESLGIQGGMGDFKSLREKLQKGGFFGAASIVGAGVGGLARGLRDDRNDPKDNPNWKPWQNRANRIRHRLATGAAGLLGSAGRNIWQQVKPGHKNIDGLQAAGDAAVAAMDAADAARERRGEDYHKLSDALRDARQNRKDRKRLRQIIRKVKNSEALDDDDKEALHRLGMSEGSTKEELEEKEKELNKKLHVNIVSSVKYTVGGKVVSKIEDLNEQLTPVSDPTKEKEKMEFAGKLKKLNGDLRDLAYEEEGSFASQAYRDYQQEQQKKISKYGENWDDDSIRDEVADRRRRIKNGSSEEIIQYLASSVATLDKKLADPNLSDEERKNIKARRDSYAAMLLPMQSDKGHIEAQTSRLEQKDQEIATAQQELTELDTKAPDYLTKKTDLEKKIQTLTNERQTIQNEIQKHTDSITNQTEKIRTQLHTEVQSEVEFEYKLSDAAYAEAQQKHADLLKQMKETAEAAADAWVYEASLDPTNLKVQDKLSAFVAENISYVRANGSEVLKTSATDQGTTVRGALEQLIGTQNLQAGEYSVEAARADQKITSQNVVEYGPEDPVTHKKTKKAYFRKGYIKDSKGNIVLSDKMMFYDTPTAPATPPSEAEKGRTEAEFYGKERVTGVKALTAASKAGKFGNDASRYTNVHEFTPKQQRAAQRREKKAEGRKG